MHFKETNSQTDQSASHMILEKLRQIKIGAVENYLKALENNREIQIVNLHDHEKNGLACVIHHLEYSAVYTIIFGNPEDNFLFQMIDNILKELISLYPQKKILFYLPGENKNLINHIQGLGFKQDYLGYEFTLDTVHLKTELPFKQTPVFSRVYSEDCFEEYINLLDRAFNPLQIKSHSRTDYFKKNRENARQQMLDAARNKCFVAFWKNDKLAGLYYARENVLDIICVHPDLQDQGIGSFMLRNYVQDMASRKTKKLFLYVIHENEKAVHFYLKNGFRLNSFFCQNSYQPESVNPETV